MIENNLMLKELGETISDIFLVGEWTSVFLVFFAALVCLSIGFFGVKLARVYGSVVSGFYVSFLALSVVYGPSYKDHFLLLLVLIWFVVSIILFFLQKITRLLYGFLMGLFLALVSFSSFMDIDSTIAIVLCLISAIAIGVLFWFFPREVIPVVSSIFGGFGVAIIFVFATGLVGIPILFFIIGGILSIAGIVIQFYFQHKKPSYPWCNVTFAQRKKKRLEKRTLKQQKKMEQQTQKQGAVAVVTANPSTAPQVERPLPPTTAPESDWDIVCSGCGEINVTHARFCNGCGKPIEINQFCGICGSGVSSAAPYCEVCGAKQKDYYLLRGGQVSPPPIATNPVDPHQNAIDVTSMELQPVESTTVQTVEPNTADETTFSPPDVSSPDVSSSHSDMQTDSTPGNQLDSTVTEEESQKS